MNWLKYSGVFMTFALNPYHWRLGCEWGQDEIMGPKSHYFRLMLLPIGINIVIDDGQW